MGTMFLFIIFYIHLCLYQAILSSSSNTLVFSAGPNSYVAFDSWRPCLNGYVRFDIRTNAHDGTLAYIDDRGKFDFFYLKLIEGKLRLLFNLGNDRQALNVNMNINDDQWHTILIKRDGQTTILNIDHGRAWNSTITNSEDLYFGGSTHQEYQASPFYFGGIPAVLERPSSGNLSSFDVYMQPRFRGRLRNLIYKNCSNPRLVQPVHLQISGGVSLTPNSHCSSRSCGAGICLINETSYQCLCDETDFQGDHCENERQPNELTFDGKAYLNYRFRPWIRSESEMIEFQMKTMHYNGLIFQLVDQTFSIRLKQGQLIVEYRWNDQLYESSSRDLQLIDNQWHQIQLKRKFNQMTLMIDEYLLQFEYDAKPKASLNFTQIYFAGNDQMNEPKFVGCIKEISFQFNDNITRDFHRDYFLNHRADVKEFGVIYPLRCSSLLSPIEFLISSSYLSLNLPEKVQQMNNYQWNISFHFQTYSSEGMIFYASNPSAEDFLGLDLIDGFLYLTINRIESHHREELFQQRINDGQTHFFHLYIQGYQGGLELQIVLDHRQQVRIPIRNFSSKIELQTLTVAGLDPAIRWPAKNFWSGIMQRGFVGCFSDLQLNGESINLTRYINGTNPNLSPKSGPCSTIFSSKRECSCDHGGECRSNSAGSSFCDCSKTGFTGRRCEHPIYHIDLSSIHTFEFDTLSPWSDQINDIAFGLKAKSDRENFIEIRPCRSIVSCDSIRFSIRNGLIFIEYMTTNATLNISSEYPFLLDNQWHYIRLYRMDTKFLLHIDHHIAQQRLNIVHSNYSNHPTIWLVFNGQQEILIEDLRLYDRSINAKHFLNNQHEQIQLKQRPWKPLNSISFYDDQDASISVQLNDVLCQECQLDSIYFDFRTTEMTGLLLFANIQTHNPKLRNEIFDKDGQYLIMKLVDGQLHLIVLVASMNEDEDEIHQIQTKIRLNDGHWHHVSLHRASEHHLELIIDSLEYYLLTSIYFLDAVYFGRPSFLSSDNLPFNHIHTLKSCVASLTLNGRSINLREFIPNHSIIRNDCFLNSLCPLRVCQNTGRCLDRMKCDCAHTSFQGQFCTDLKTGYLFNDQTPGLIFDQPYQAEKRFQLYRISFGLLTKVVSAEIIRVSDQIQIESFRGHIRIKVAGQMHNDQEFLENNIVVNDGAYHLVQIQYNQTGHLRLIVDNHAVEKQLPYRLMFDKPLLLLIGQNPAFRQGFQGHLYGLESDIYSVFDLISPTFQRLSYAPVQDKSFSTLFPNASSSSVLRFSSLPEDDLSLSVCPYQSYDDVCLMTPDNSPSPLKYPDPTLLTSVWRNSSKSLTSKLSTSRLSSMMTTVVSPLMSSYSDWNTSMNSTANSTRPTHESSLISIAVHSTTNSYPGKRFHWRNIWIYIVLIALGVFIVLFILLCAYIKYRRKDVGVYEVEEAQRFRPLIVELSPSPGEKSPKISHPSKSPSMPVTTDTSGQQESNRTRKKQRRKKSSKAPTDEQREFYI